MKKETNPILRLCLQITEEEFVYDCLNNDQLYRILRESSKKNYDSSSSSSGEDQDTDEGDDEADNQDEEDLETDDNLKD